MFLGSTEWRVFFVSCVMPVGHVREHAPSFYALLPRNHIHSVAKNHSYSRMIQSPQAGRKPKELADSNEELRSTERNVIESQ